MNADLASTTNPSRSDALARATALASRAKELRRAQVEVHDLTAREVQVMARTAASFFDAIPLPEFTASLLPTSARVLRRMRHRILHRTVHTTATGTMIHAMLLGRDGVLRLFSARTADSRDLLLSLEPGRGLPPTVIRDVVEWTPLLRVAGFPPFEILEKLSVSLDAVEAQIADAEEKVQVQKQALASGDLTALLPTRPEAPRLPAGSSSEDLDDEVDESEDVVDVRTPSAVAIVVQDEPAAVTPAAAPVIARPLPSNPFDIFDVVEAVAATASPRPASPAASVPAAVDVPAPSSRYALDDEPEEWDEREEIAPPSVSPVRTALFPVLPPPR
jgi:DNA-binding CsgD family transcriptional regulator